jgi:hypothetical protein
MFIKSALCKEKDASDDDDVDSEDDAPTKKPSRKYSSESVSAWMRRSSGVISDDHLGSVL